MRITPPYQVVHFYLNGLPFPSSLSAADKGRYLVFWWQDLALGHLFVEPGKSFPEEKFYNEILDAIQPALHFYALKNGCTEEKVQQVQNNPPKEKLYSLLQTVFTPWMLPQNLPASVPVSVIICTRNRAAHLQQCLQSLYSLPCRPQEIIVVDNAPVDDSSEKITQKFPGVVYVKEPRPGLDIARNTGAKQASCAVVAYTDDDVQVHPHWIYRVWEAFQNPEVHALTGLVLAAQLETEAQLIFEKHWSFNRGYADNFYDAAYFKNTLVHGPPVWEIGAGANMAFRKSVFEKVGFFDEILDAGAAGCNGDSEIWFRILAGGYTIHYNPRAIVFHEHRKDLPGLKSQLFYYLRGFITSVLLQQKQQKNAGYNRFLLIEVPRYYLRLFAKGFPFYRFRYRTLGVELKGIFAGLLYYRNNRKHSSIHSK